jgi:hypothetical protein
MTSASIFPAILFSNPLQETGRLILSTAVAKYDGALGDLGSGPGKGPDVLVNLRLAPEAEGLRSGCQVRPSSGPAFSVVKHLYKFRASTTAEVRSGTRSHRAAPNRSLTAAQRTPC